MENGLNTGIKAFDEIVGEVQRSEVIVIAGRPGMGKTTLALQILAKSGRSFIPHRTPRTIKKKFANRKWKI